MPELENGGSGNGIAIGGLVTAVAAATVAVADAIKVFGGNGSGKAELRDENILLKAELKNKDLEIKLARQEEQINAQNQAIAFGFQNLRQYIDGGFVHADKCVNAAQLNPPVMGAFGVPSNFQAAYVPCPVPFVNPYANPYAFALPKGSGSGTSDASNGGGTNGQSNG